LDIFSGEIFSHDGRFVYRIGAHEFDIPTISHLPDSPLDLGVRPEHVYLGTQGIPAVVHLVQPIGPFTYVTVSWEGGSATARVSGVSSLRPKDPIRVAFDPEGLLFFERETSKRVILA
jgi:ABC-type sugar transport system ATPase subunit